MSAIRIDQNGESGPISGLLDLGATRPEQPIGSVLVAIPAYNEERFIGSVVLQARLSGLYVLVVDDGSDDRTAEVAAAAGARVESHETNLGKAEALNTAFHFARYAGVDALVVLDGDGQHDTSEIEELLAPILSGEADIAIGSRFLDDSRGDIPTVRRLGQKAMTTMTNIGSGTPVTDSQSGFRAFSRRAIETLHFGVQGFSVEVEMQFWARAHKLAVKEVPITAIYTDPPKRNILSHGFQVFNGVLLLVGRHRPLLFFGFPGMFLLLVGLGVGILVTNIYQNTQVLAIGYSLIAVVCTIAGLLALFTGILLHSVRGTFLDLERRLRPLFTNGNGISAGKTNDQ